MITFTLERVTQPEIEPVTLEEMKRHLRINENVGSPFVPGPEDDDITALIVAGREWVESYTGRALIDQEWRLNLGEEVGITGATIVSGTGINIWLPDGIRLCRSPVLAVSSVSTLGSDGTQTPVEETAYEVREQNSKWPRIVNLGSGWTAGSYRIKFRAGYADRDASPQQGADVVPARFKQALKLWVEAMYDRDEKLMPMLLDTAERIIRPERADLQFS